VELDLDAGEMARVRWGENLFLLRIRLFEHAHGFAEASSSRPGLVDSLSAAEMREYRGTMTRGGKSVPTAIVRIREPGIFRSE